MSNTTDDRPLMKLSVPSSEILAQIKDPETTHVVVAGMLRKSDRVLNADIVYARRRGGGRG